MLWNRYAVHPVRVSRSRKPIFHSEYQLENAELAPACPSRPHSASVRPRDGKRCEAAVLAKARQERRFRKCGMPPRRARRRSRCALAQPQRNDHASREGRAAFRVSYPPSTLVFFTLTHHLSYEYRGLSSVSNRRSVVFKFVLGYVIGLRAIPKSTLLAHRIRITGVSVFHPLSRLNLRLCDRIFRQRAFGR